MVVGVGVDVDVGVGVGVGVRQEVGHNEGDHFAISRCCHDKSDVLYALIRIFVMWLAGSLSEHLTSEPLPSNPFPASAWCGVTGRSSKDSTLKIRLQVFPSFCFFLNLRVD